MLHRYSANDENSPIPDVTKRHSGEAGWSGQAQTQPQVVVIDPRPLARDCFVHCLEAYRAGVVIESHASIEAWRDGHPQGEKQVILYNIGSGSLLDERTAAEVNGVIGMAGACRVIILADQTDLESMLAAIACGAAGFVPPDGKFADVVEAIRIVHSGGTYLPRSSLVTLSKALAANQHSADESEDHFTERQLAVARALQRGAANKTIAYELNLCESTVKVHIRNIMRKVNATNRTQAAQRLNSLIGTGDKAGPATH